MKASGLSSVNNDLRIVFAGTPDFAATALSHLLQNSFHIQAVYTQPDRPAGRGQKVIQSPVKKLALASGLPVHQPTSFKDPEEIARLAALDADIMIVAAYGIILPADILAMPKRGCINIHASLLPRWRGAAPIQRAILAGDSETGITIMQMEAGLDTGPILLTRATGITDQDTSISLHNRLAALGGKTIVEALRQLEDLQPLSQDSRLATYAHRLAKSEGNIDWTLSAEHISRMLRAFTPWPGCFSKINGTVIKIHHAAPGKSENNPVAKVPESIAPGSIIGRSASGIQVACGEGWLNITGLQLPGARAMEVKEFVNGNQLLLVPGQQFSNESD